MKVNNNLKANLIALICLIIDQISKLIIVSKLSLYETKIIFKNFFNITYVQNTGAAFSILNGKTVLFSLAAIIILLVINIYIKKNNTNKLETLSLGILSGGIIGNLIDRIFRGYVIDFFDFKIFGYNFPVFNIADTFICLSVFCLIIITLKSGDKNELSSNK